MALKEADRANFETLMKAARNEDLALVESTCSKTGEYRALLCAIGKDDEGMYLVTPLGQLCTGNPFEDYTDPTAE